MMTIFLEDLFREVNILNWYKGEAVKRGDDNADVVQTSTEQQDAMMYHLRTAITEIPLLANINRVMVTWDVDDEELTITINPVRKGKEYLLDLLTATIKQYLVYEIRRLWMVMVKPEWEDNTMRESLRRNIRDVMYACTDSGTKVRRRATTMGI